MTNRRWCREEQLPAGDKLHQGRGKHVNWKVQGKAGHEMSQKMTLSGRCNKGRWFSWLDLVWEPLLGPRGAAECKIAMAKVHIPNSHATKMVTPLLMITTRMPDANSIIFGGAIPAWENSYAPGLENCDAKMWKLCVVRFFFLNLDKHVMTKEHIAQKMHRNFARVQNVHVWHLAQNLISRVLLGLFGQHPVPYFLSFKKF